MIALGTMTFGDPADEAESRRIVDLAFDRGITHFDTANVYNRGRSEEILGRLLKGRTGFTVASKVGSKTSDPGENLRRDHVLASCDASLKRLGLDRIDLYYMHQPDDATPIEETLGAMEALVKAGKVSRVGASNFAAWQLMRTLETVRVVQPIYNLVAREIERELLPMCRTFDLEVLVYNPLAGGLLTGKHRAGPYTEGTRFARNALYQKRYWHDAMFRAASDLERIAKEAGKSMVELALQWVKSRNVGLILGATRAAQLKENLDALEGSLDETMIAACDEVYARLHGPIPKYNR
jgi:aryl-alcohol dehydrogenase-like predicted oxidoreductase